MRLIDDMCRVLPILFNTEMTRVILDGRKTVTRRLVKKSQCMLADRKEPHELDRKYAPFDGMTDAELVECTYRPPYQPDDILYVRETWRVGAWDIRNQMIAFDYKDGTGGELVHIHDRELFERLVDQSREDARKARCEYNGVDFVWEKGKSPCRWHPSIHMPKEAARIWLKVTDVRVERLHDMTLDDFLAEGVVIRPEAFNDPENAYMQARSEFARIWDSTTRKSQTVLNPWVWVIEFERCAESTFAMSAAMPLAQDAAQPLLIPHDYRNVKVADGMTTTIDLEDLKKQLGESHFRQIGLNYGV